METILALVVVIAVIIFGALISIGNEHQRKAIDDLREQIVLWAIQDLRIKREKITRDVRIDDSLVWLNHLTGKIIGHPVQLSSKEFFDSPTALVYEIDHGDGKAVFTPLAPREIRQLRKQRKNRLDQYSQGNPLFVLPKNTTAFEISVLNANALFDLELPIAWKSLTGKEIDQHRIWLYWIS
jgi:hypothetical protein